MPLTSAARPIATATIDPTGRRAKVPRDHSITVEIQPSAPDARYADKGYLAGILRRSFEGDATAGAGGQLVCAGKPGVGSVERLRAALLGEGLRVTIRERRECSEPGCASDAMMPWNRATDTPSGWYSNLVCGRHNYRACTGCGSVYLLTSTNSAGQAPSVRCEVCGDIIIAWGGSKIWNAEMVERGGAR